MSSNIRPKETVEKMRIFIGKFALLFISKSKHAHTPPNYWRTPSLQLGTWDQPWRFYIYYTKLSYSFWLTKPLCSSILYTFSHAIQFGLVLNSVAGILSSGLPLHIHIKILESFVSSLITSSLTGKIVFSI